MKTIFIKFKKWYSNRRRDYYVYRLTDTTTLPFLFWLVGFYVSIWRQKHCRHEFECYSHITPETGSETFCCKKCGYTYEIIYY